jgi:hypothetical protein
MSDMNGYYEYPMEVSKDLVEDSNDCESFIALPKRCKNFMIYLEGCPSWKYHEDGAPYVYFKIYISHRAKIDGYWFLHLKSTKIYRISIYGPEYVFATDNGTSGYLSKEEVAAVIDILKSPEAWSNVITGLNWEHHWDSKENKITCIPWKPIPENLPMPDYAKLPTRD